MLEEEEAAAAGTSADEDEKRCRNKSALMELRRGVMAAHDESVGELILFIYVLETVIDDMDG